MMILIIIAAVIGYLLGSINTSLVVGKLFYKKDVRNFGSGNAGATNTLRTLGKSAALAVLSGDILKGVLASLTGYYLAGETSPGVYSGLYAAGLFAVIGHNWPVYFGFKGGKGVLTSFAVALTFSPVAALICLGGFIIIVIFTKYVSLGSMVCAVLFPFVASLTGGPLIMIITGIIMAVLIVFRHASNIKRLLAGEEKKLSFRKQPESQT